MSEVRGKILYSVKISTRISNLNSACCWRRLFEVWGDSWLVIGGLNECSYDWPCRVATELKAALYLSGDLDIPLQFCASQFYVQFRSQVCKTQRCPQQACRTWKRDLSHLVCLMVLACYSGAHQRLSDMDSSSVLSWHKVHQAKFLQLKHLYYSQAWRPNEADMFAERWELHCLHNRACKTAAYGAHIGAGKKTHCLTPGKRCS